MSWQASQVGRQVDAQVNRWMVGFLYGLMDSLIGLMGGFSCLCKFRHTNNRKEKLVKQLDKLGWFGSPAFINLDLIARANKGNRSVSDVVCSQMTDEINLCVSAMDRARKYGKHVSAGSCRCPGFAL